MSTEGRRVKICGITRYEDAALAAQLGAWALGFIFYEKSPRYITPEAAAKIARRLRGEGRAPEKLVGVFVDAAPSEMLRIRDEVGLTSLQLHGHEEPNLVRSLDAEVIKAVRPSSPEEIAGVAEFSEAAFLLVDAVSKSALGGTGTLADWKLAAALGASRRLFLAGGIGPNNIVSAFETVSPYAVDLSSGVESSPGIKSPALLRRLFSLIGSVTYEDDAR